MKRTRVKICGLKTIEDASAAVHHGADAIGLNFYPKSARYVDIETAQKISRSLPSFINKVALFVDADATFINEVLGRVDIDTLQFHGQEAEDFCKCFNKPYIKALSPKDFNKLNNYPSSVGLLLDSYDPNSIGGTGEAFDWKTIPDGHKHSIILAGGLNAANVGLAIKTVSPFAVDVSSGVEKTDKYGERVKGHKDYQLISDFMQAIKSADIDTAYKN